ncbi:MAG: sulfonate ABC transporter substrate-binding protein [Hydrogenophaga sp.]|jgi:sulfonate transport system substrate-binding protein|uniref:sulfonate ABC transporter substrate-binding protein n=1 Tax=Hydrogenophaga sp. TaxID=1904254 RepID=UPI001D6791DC|nr:sulfonate ABC transporter substrate-binding protein [Hydrogenophaga sp.]MBW0170477.1 sulfonate ABC transporter substrate-binding protein [Hydrogenophaga sp.]MBW0186259.1 sulfonate ABC transporter substrate-binding protein [Hydrogenophaga sp.]
MSELFQHHPEAGAPTTPSRFARLRQWALGLLVFVVAAFGLALLLLPVPQAKAQGKGELRIGYQKSASLFVLQKAQGSLEKKLAPLGFGVKWVEFPAGPQLLEGLNVGAVDVGYVGEAPPIFAQAAGAQFVYFGFDPAAPRAEAILVTKDSPIKSVADLKGKKVALNKGSNVHYLLVKQLEKHGLKITDIQPVYLAPADGRAAFESRNVDAWVIWDPFQAAAEKATGARVLADGTGGVVNNYQYYLGARKFVSQNPKVIEALFEDSVSQGIWLKKNLRQAAELIAPLQGLPVDVVELALQRYEFNVKPITPAVAADQQKIADTFFDLKLIPKAIRISEAVVVSQP